MTGRELEWSRGDRAKAAAKLMVGWVALLWLLEVVDVASGHALDGLGITPRTPSELVDVVPAAFIHFGFAHVAANSVPLLVMGFLAALGGLRRFAAVCALIIVADGLGVWLIAPAHTNTAGASGVIFGLFGYLLVSGFVERAPVGRAGGSAGRCRLGHARSWRAWRPTQTGRQLAGAPGGPVAGVAAAFVFRRRTQASAPEPAWRRRGRVRPSVPAPAGPAAHTRTGRSR